MTRGAFEPGETDGPRWELALERMNSGHAIRVGMVEFRRVDPATVEAAVVSSWWHDNVSRSRASEELYAARAATEDLLAGNPDFATAVGTSELDYVLVIDYEIGSIALCRLVGDVLEWIDPVRDPGGDSG